VQVYLLWHVNELPDDEEDLKFIGVYATAHEAECAKQSLLCQPGFWDSPDGFQIEAQTVGQTGWTEGFVIKTQEDVIRDWQKAQGEGGHET
jgi:hypothetical protein